MCDDNSLSVPSTGQFSIRLCFDTGIFMHADA